MERDLLLSEITPELRERMCAGIDRGWESPETTTHTIPDSGKQGSDTPQAE